MGRTVNATATAKSVRWSCCCTSRAPRRGRVKLRRAMWSVTICTSGPCSPVAFPSPRGISSTRELDTCADDQDQGILILKLRKDQEIKLRCIAKKVRVQMEFCRLCAYSHIHAFYDVSRALPRSTQSGVQPVASRSSTTPIIGCDTSTTGWRRMRRRSGQRVDTLTPTTTVGHLYSVKHILLPVV